MSGRWKWIFASSMKKQCKLKLQGDTGGGLICDNLLTGVVAHINGCGVANFPTIYTEVAVYNAWINWAINFNGGHDIVPTPTPVTPLPTTTPIITTTTPAPDNGATGVVGSIFLSIVCSIVIFFK